MTAEYSRQERVFRVLEGESSDRLGRVVNAFFIILICLNVLAVILETDKGVHDHNSLVFYSFLLFSTIVFTVEYVLRVWACTADTRFGDPVRGRIHYALTPLSLIDLITVIPFYLTFFIQDQPFVRVLRLLIVLRIFKLSRYNTSFNVLGSVLRKKRWELFATVIIGATLLIVASTLMYLVEGPVQPDKFGSIPDAMWWACDAYDSRLRQCLSDHRPRKIARWPHRILRHRTLRPAHRHTWLRILRGSSKTEARAERAYDLSSLWQSHRSTITILEYSSAQILVKKGKVISWAGTRAIGRTCLHTTSQAFSGRIIGTPFLSPFTTFIYSIRKLSVSEWRECQTASNHVGDKPICPARV